MALRIVLDRPGSYSPGDTITGHVELKSSSDEAIAYIDIHFTGRCKVKIRKHDHYTTISYRSRGYYFAQHVSLYADGKFKHKAGTYTWPFTFVLPDHAARRPVVAPTPPSKPPTSWRPPRHLSATGVLQPSVGPEWESDIFSVTPPFQASALNALQPHRLPDSFAYSRGGFPADVEGRVEYTLVANLTRPAGSILFAPKNLETAATVLVQSFRPRTARDPGPSLQTHTSTHTVATLRLLPSKMDRKLSWLEKTRLVLGASTVPTCTFRVVVATPRYLRAGTDPAETLPLTVVVSRLKRPPSEKIEAQVDDIPTPAVRLTTFAFWIRARTLLRDNGKAAIDPTVDYEDRVFYAPRTGLDIDIPVRDAAAVFDPPAPAATHPGESTSPEPTGPEARPPLDLGNILNLRLDPGVLPPDFSTYNIYRSYTLGYKLKLDALGESMEVSQDGVRVRVLQEWAPPASGMLPRLRRPYAPRAPPTPPPGRETQDGKDGPFPPEPPPAAHAGDDQLPQYEHHAPEGPLPAFER